MKVSPLRPLARSAGFGLLALAFTVGLTGRAHASVITVAPSAATGTSTGCSLTDAILAANASTAGAGQNVTKGACTPAGTPGAGGDGFGNGNVIELAAGSYVFTSPNNDWYGPNALPPIASAIVIVGDPGGSVIERSTASGTAPFRLFYVGGGQSLAGYNAPNVASGKLPGPGHLTLVNVTVANGRAKGGDAEYAAGGLGAGGAIYNQGALTLKGVTLRGNVAVGGSARVGSQNWSGGGMGNVAGGTPGGFILGSWPTSSAQYGTFGNGGMPGSAGGGAGQHGGVGGGGGSGGDNMSGVGGNGGHGGYGGGGGHAGSGTTSGAISGSGGFGGGAASGGGPTSPGSPGFGASGGVGGDGGGAGLGGAVFNEGGTVAVLNSTVTGNTARGGNADYNANGADGYGGGLFNLNGTVTLRYSTFADNTVIGGSHGPNAGSNGAAKGGAVYNLYLANPGSPAADAGSAATMTVNSSILAGSVNRGGSAVSDCENNAGTFTSGYDVVQTLGSCTFNYNDQNTLPQLATSGAAANGGPTPTFALQNSSPAIDMGDTGTGLGVVPTLDQRGYLRDSQPDVGSYEAGASPPTVGVNGLADATIKAGNGASDTQSFTLSDPAGSRLTVTATSSNATVLPSAGISVGSACGSDSGHYGCTLTLTPAANQTGKSTVTVRATDIFGHSGQRTMVLTVGAPKVNLSATSLAFAGQLVGTSAGKTLTLTNSGTVSLSISGITIGGANSSEFSEKSGCPLRLAAGASCAITVSYAPKALASASATLAVATDAASSPDQVTLSGTGTDTAPTASNGSVNTSAGSAVSATLSGSDVDSGQSLTYSIVTQPAHGTVTLTDTATGAFTYTPASGYTGDDSFTFKVNDGYKSSTVATESITVTGTAVAKPGGSGGGGALGPWVLAALGLLAAFLGLRRR